MGLLQLDNLVRIRQLKAESPSQAEMDGLTRSGNARLKGARNQTLKLDSRLYYGGKSHGQLQHCKHLYGSDGLYAVSKRQISTREIKAHGLR
jgi:hypothetical protein